MIVKISGGNAKFKEFLHNCGEITFLEFDNAELAISNEEVCDAYMLLPEQGKDRIETLPYECIERLAALKKQGSKIYLENYMSQTFYQGCVTGYEIISEPNHIFTEVLTCDGRAKDYFGGKMIFQARQKSYLPSVNRIGRDSQGWGWDRYDGEVLLRLGKHFGTELTEDDNRSDLGILYRSEGLYASLISLSCFDGITMLPHYRYAQLYGFLFGEILGLDKQIVEKAFLACFSKIDITMRVHEEITSETRKNIYENTVKSAVQWHYDSGMLDGHVSYEMIASSNGMIYNNRRVDAGMYTGWLLYAAGDYFCNEEWKKKGKSIFDFYAENAQIKKGEFKGLFKWYLNENAGPRQCYTIDCGRDGISLINMYRLTGDKSYLDKAKALADGFLDWFNGDLLRTEWVDYNDDSSNDRHLDGTMCTPGISGDMGLFMMMAAEMLSDTRYSEVCIRLATRLCNEEGGFVYHGHTTSVRYARFLMLLSAVQNSGLADFTDKINELLDYLHKLQLPCGAIYVEDNLSFKNHGENGIIVPWENEKLTDQLYCVNNILVALSTISSAKHTEGIRVDIAKEMLEGLLDYTSKIQIKNSGPKYDGGWMRAFDVTREEYYGMDLDMFWGAYCIMSGWIMGIIPLGFLAELRGDSNYILS